MLRDGDATREEQAASYAESVIKADKAMEALDEAIGLVSSLQAGVTFL